MAIRLPYYSTEGDIYSQIMQQMQQGQPLAFTNPYGEGFTGGYNPRLYDRRPTPPTPAPDASGLLGGGDSGGDYGVPSSGQGMDPTSMISAGQALQGYGRSFGGFAPFGTIAGLLGSGLTNYGINQLGEMEMAAAQAEAEAAAMGALAGLSSAEAGQAEANAVAAAEAAAAAESMGAAAAADAAAAAGIGGDMGGYGGDGGGYGGSDSSAGADSGGDSAGWAKGGKVTMNGLLTDIDPPGPDEGYGALQAGEYVIKKSTAKKLGDKKLNALNEGRATIKMRK